MRRATNERERRLGVHAREVERERGRERERERQTEGEREGERESQTFATRNTSAAAATADPTEQRVSSANAILTRSTRRQWRVCARARPGAAVGVTRREREREARRAEARPDCCLLPARWREGEREREEEEASAAFTAASTARQSLAARRLGLVKEV